MFKDYNWKMILSVNWYYRRNNIKYEKNVHVPVAEQEKITCASGLILVPQSVDELHMMLINEIIIIHLSE